MIDQIAYQIERYPESDLTNRLIEFYNAQYRALEGDLDPYTVCEPGEGDLTTIGQAFDFILETAEALGRRDGRRLILNTCRLLRRALIERVSTTIP